MKILIAREEHLVVLAGHDRHIRAEVLAQKINNGEIYIAYEEGAFAGWLRYSLFWDNTPFMNMLFVLSEYRKLGIGKQLTLFWEDQMKSKGYQTLMTSTQQNETAQHFYSRLGYHAVGGFMQESGEFELLFSKEIEFGDSIATQLE